MECYRNTNVPIYIMKSRAYAYRPTLLVEDAQPFAALSAKKRLLLSLAHPPGSLSTSVCSQSPLSRAAHPKGRQTFEISSGALHEAYVLSLKSRLRGL